MQAAEQSGIPDTTGRLRHFGIKGQDMFTKQLPYIMYNNLFVVPTYHCLLYGVVKKLWTMALTPSNGMIDRASLNKIKARAGGVVTTDDFNARYSCIVRHHANWKIYDWHTWADVWSNFVLDGIRMNGTVPTT
jgi:hypothetical protein